MQAAFFGRRPARSIRLRKQDGNLTTGPEELKQFWHEHFSRVLNVSSQCNQELDEIPSWEVMHSLDVSLTSAELSAALERLKCGKAGGRTGVLLELILCVGPVLHHRVLVLLEAIWTAGVVVRDWKDAENVRLPMRWV